MKSVSAPTYDETSHPEFIWRSGVLQRWEEATVHVNAAGHASVSAVFEGVKAYLARDGRTLNLFRAREHMLRFEHSCRISWMQMEYDADSLVSAIQELMKANGVRGDTYIRPWCFAKGIVRGMMVPANQPTEVAIDHWGFESSLGTDRGCRAMVSSWRRNSDETTPPRVKAFSNYHNGRLALLEAKRLGVDTCVMLGLNGKVAEGPASCVAIVRNGALITPAVTESILESVTRDTMLTLAREALGIEVQERPIDRSELYLADEAFFMGTAWELLPIVEVDGIRVGDGAMGPICKALDAEYENLVRGTTPDHRGWLLPLEPSA